MQIKIALPDDLGYSLEAKRGNLEDKLLEMIVIQSYCEGSISVGKGWRIIRDGNSSGN